VKKQVKTYDSLFIAYLDNFFDPEAKSLFFLMRRFITNKSGLDAVPLLLVFVVDFQKVIVH
jgi:hypothetical protein